MSMKRLRYFNGQFLKQEDFTDEQAYHLAMRRRHNTGVHTPGVVEGLNVVPSLSDPNQIVVEAGWAVDTEGREMILDAPKNQVIGTSPPYYVTCKYDEQSSDPQAEGETGIPGDRRTIEIALIEALGAAPPAGVLVLAEVNRDGGNLLVITDRRAWAGMGLPGDLTVGGTLKTSHASGKLQVDAPVEISGDLKVQGNLEIQGATTVVQTQQMRGNVQLGDEDADTITVEGKIVTGHSSGKLQIDAPVQVSGALTLPGDPTDSLHAVPKQYVDAKLQVGALPTTGGTITGNLQVDGNVGIGTATPGAKLDVAGALRISTGANPILINSAHTEFSNSVMNQAEISNDTGNFKTLMIVGNRSAGLAGPSLGRRVSVWDILDVNGNLNVNGNVGIGTASPTERLDVRGNISLDGRLTISGAIVQEDWVAPSLQSGWVNYANGFNPAGYFRDKQGIVHLRGLVRAGVVGQGIFGLPVGYRPEFRELHAVQTNSNAIGRCDILTSGEVVPVSGNNEWFSLDGISFRALRVGPVRPPPVLDPVRPPIGPIRPIR